MKRVFSSVIPSHIALGTAAVLVAAGIGVASTTVTGIQIPPNYDSYTPPSAGGTYVDPVFGTTIKRITNSLATTNADKGGSLSWIETEYSTASAFNNDNSKFVLLHVSYFGLYAGDGSFLRNLPLEINSGSEPRWSRKDNSTIYYHAANMLKSYNVDSGATAVVHTFSEYSTISGNGEMDISRDGDHFVFAGDGHSIFVYEISSDKKYNALDTGSTRFDSLYITPNNNVIVSWYPSGTVRYTGQELFDSNMNFLRQVGRADGHKHLTVDTNGQEVLIWTNSADPQPIANCENGIVKITLADASETCLVQLDWGLAVHITAPDGNGTAFVETYAPADPLPGSSGWAPYTNELIQVKLDGSGVLARLVHHRSQPHDSYIYMPKMTVSRDGSRVLYSSNFDLQKLNGYANDYADAYMLVVPGGSGSLTATSGATTSTATDTTSTAAPTTSSTGSGSTGSTTPAPATTAAAVGRSEQDNAAVSYSGSWFPNGGAFNSGGTAAMAMDANAQATFKFTGTAVKWIGFSDPWSGIAQVYLDGTLAATVDTYAADQAAQKVQYSASNLANSAHTLTIISTGTKSSGSAGAWVWVDAFDVTSVSLSAPPTPAAVATAAPAGSSALVQQDNSLLQYSGTWFPNLGAFNSGGSAVLATDAGSQVQFAFAGTAVSWIGFSDPWSGIAQVFIDGNLAATVDTYSSVQKSQAVQYTAANLGSGSHTIKIVATGARSGSSGGAWVWVDAFNVTQ